MKCKDFEQEIHVDDIGTIFEVTIIDPETDREMDISDATETLIYLLKPAVDNDTPPVRLDKTASFVTDGTNGKIQYATIAGDLDLDGTYKIQARVTTPDGVWNSQIQKLKVKKNL